MSDPTLASWVIGAVAAGIIGVLAFLVRNAFENVSRGIDGINGKLDAMSKDISKGDGDRRELSADVRALSARLERLERELSEGRS